VYYGLVANIIDVARRAGVSATTAKRAVRDPDKLAPETLARVRKAIEELNYEPDEIAAALRRQHSNTIGMVVGSIVQPFFALLTRSVNRAVRERGYTFILGDSEYRTDLELELLQKFHGQRVAGIILRSGYGDPNLDYLRKIQASGIRIVEVDHISPGSPFAHVMLDGKGTVQAGVRHLASFGHTRIAALGDYHPTLNPDERSAAFPGVMAAEGLTVPDAYRVPIPPVENAAYEAARRIMALPEPPTALFALNGSMAVGTYRALKDMAFRIPEDVSLVAFDDYPWTSLVDPGIDVLEQPIEEMGRTAAKILFDAIDRNAIATERRRFPARLIVRGSCAAPRRELQPLR